MLTPAQYEAMRAGIAPFVHTDEYGAYTIANLYYDTENFSLIRTSLEKPIYKEKLRMRSYGVPGDNDMVFVEIKKKFDGVVYKRRIELTAKDAVSYLNDGLVPTDENQICREIDWFLTSYRPHPCVYIAYDREAYAGNDDPELRITFDTNLRARESDLDLRAGDWGEPLLPSDQILMEIKIPGTTPLWLAHLLSEIGAFTTSFSKYGTWYRQQLKKQLNKGDVPCA
jgi:hypothetical protein